MATVTLVLGNVLLPLTHLLSELFNFDLLSLYLYTPHMSQDNLVKMKSSAGTLVYTRKNKKKLANVKLELKKYDPKLRKRVVFKEVKK